MVTFVWMILGDRIRITWDYVEILTIRISIPRRIRSAQPMRSRDKLRSTVDVNKFRGLVSARPCVARADDATDVAASCSCVDCDCSVQLAEQQQSRD